MAKSGKKDDATDTFDKAKQICTDLGMDLPMIHTEADYNIFTGKVADLSF